MNKKHGTLYVVATPIGNLQDVTLRALTILKQVERIAAEDTRHAAILLNHFGIHKPILSLHDFNEQARVEAILSHIEQGESIALISDAGTPLISDPGYHLTRAARARSIAVVPVPGACAAIAALSVAGLPTDRFVFEGFLPAKTQACFNRLSILQHESRTMVFYEAPHRLLATLSVMCQVFGEAREAVIARELTKQYESVLGDSLAACQAYYEAHAEQLRGEIVILLAGHQATALEEKTVSPEQVLSVLLAELPLKQAVSLASEILGERKNVLYEKALAMRAE